MNPSYRRRFCGILAAACMLTTATVPAVSPVFSQVSLSVAAAEETDFYKGLKYLKYSDYAEVIDCDQTRTTIKIPSSIGGNRWRKRAGNCSKCLFFLHLSDQHRSNGLLAVHRKFCLFGLCFPEQYPVFTIAEEHRRPCLFQLCIVAERCHSSNPDNTGRKCIWRLHQLADVCG